MSAHAVSPDEPEATIYGPAWLEARHRLRNIASAEARALLTSAMDRVESGWPAVRGLQQWVEQNRSAQRTEDDYGCLLTYVETEVRESFRSMALALANVAADWPGWERESNDDVDGYLSAFARYVTVLQLATQAATVPPEFRALVRQVGPLRLASEWVRQLSGILQAIGDHSTTAASVRDAQGAVEFLTSALPEGKREQAKARLLTNVEVLFALGGASPPEWLILMREYLAGQPHDAGSSKEHGE